MVHIKTLLFSLKIMWGLISFSKLFSFKINNENYTAEYKIFLNYSRNTSYKIQFYDSIKSDHWNSETI